MSERFKVVIFRILTCFTLGDVLLAAAIRRLLSKVKLDKKDIDFMVAGNVFHETNSPNIAQTASVKAGLSTPSYSISMACISGQAAISKAVAMVEDGTADVVLAGGVEYLTDLPILWNKNVRKALLAASRSHSRKERTRIYSKLRLDDLKPEILKVVEFRTKETFVFNGDKISAKFGISRQEQDEYGFRSHLYSKKARSEGKFPFICSVSNGATKKSINFDNTIRKVNKDKMNSMRSVLKGGTVSRATANQPCDGAAICVITSEKAAENLNLTPKARLSHVYFSAASPADKLLSGTAHALARLKSRDFNLETADVLEFYEGFSGEILAQLAALRCPKYAKQELGLMSPVADLDVDRLNLWGGSIGLGHAFGATGIRLLLHTVGRLHDEDGSLGLVAGCAGGGLGSAFAVSKVQ